MSSDFVQIIRCCNLVLVQPANALAIRRRIFHQHLSLLADALVGPLVNQSLCLAATDNAFGACFDIQRSLLLSDAGQSRYHIDKLTHIVMRDHARKLLNTGAARNASENNHANV